MEYTISYRNNFWEILIYLDSGKTKVKDCKSFLSKRLSILPEYIILTQDNKNLDDYSILSDYKITNNCVISMTIEITIHSLRNSNKESDKYDLFYMEYDETVDNLKEKYLADVNATDVKLGNLCEERKLLREYLRQGRFEFTASCPEIFPIKDEMGQIFYIEGYWNDTVCELRQKMIEMQKLKNTIMDLMIGSVILSPIRKLYSYRCIDPFIIVAGFIVSVYKGEQCLMKFCVNFDTCISFLKNLLSTNFGLETELISLKIGTKYLDADGGQTVGFYRLKEGDELQMEDNVRILVENITDGSFTEHFAKKSATIVEIKRQLSHELERDADKTILLIENKELNDESTLESLEIDDMIVLQIQERTGSKVEDNEIGKNIKDLGNEDDTVIDFGASVALDIKNDNVDALNAESIEDLFVFSDSTLNDNRNSVIVNYEEISKENMNDIDQNNESKEKETMTIHETESRVTIPSENIINLSIETEQLIHQSNLINDNFEKKCMIGENSYCDSETDNLLSDENLILPIETEQLMDQSNLLNKNFENNNIIDKNRCCDEEISKNEEETTESQTKNETLKDISGDRIFLPIETEQFSDESNINDENLESKFVIDENNYCGTDILEETNENEIKLNNEEQKGCDLNNRTEPTDGQIQITVRKNLSDESSTETVNISVRSDDKVVSLRKQIDSVFMIKSTNYVISFKREILKDENQLSQYGICDGDEILISHSLMVKCFVGCEQSVVTVLRFAFLPEDKVRDLQQQIVKKANVAGRSFNLSFNGSSLDEGSTMYESGVENESYLLMSSN